MSLISIDEMIAKGWGRAVTVGAFSTGIVGGGAGTVLDAQQPELAVAVPPNFCIRPIYIEVVVQGGISTADSDEAEINIAVDSLGMWTGDGTFTSEQPANMRTDLDVGSSCRVGSAFSANMTTTPPGGSAAAPVRDMELAGLVETADQAGTAANVAYRIIRLLYQPNYPPFLVGPCTLLVYFGGTIATVGGFVRAQWVEASKSFMVPAL